MSGMLIRWQDWLVSDGWDAPRGISEAWMPKLSPHGGVYGGPLGASHPADTGFWHPIKPSRGGFNHDTRGYTKAPV
ncbi:hypothetical protein GCM10007392_28570 [Saccharospirillum salsuginis]|uniref:Uncharacterized protein n=1 Tax=Saccharospirillum salsuginis TaxID=418750 RepID=A0A918NDC4_9GAMM|nr:hypothetical protein GCM10007392_28570 [Saccharospirillum salsuginis]